MRLRFFLWYIRAMSVEKTLYFVDGALQEKHQHAVAGLHVGVAADEHAAAVADECGQGHAARKAQVFYGSFRDA